MILAGIALLCVACSNESELTVSSEKVETPVTVSVSNFSMSVDEFQNAGTRTRAAQDLADYANVRALTLAFYKSDGTESYKSTQLRADASTYETFGEFSTSLSMGSYTMVVIGYAGTSPFTLTSATLATCTDTRLQDTFVATQAVNITGNSAVNLTAELDRVVSRLGIVSTDHRTSDAAKVRMTFTGGGRIFNPSTGLASTNTGFDNTLTFVEAVGATTSSASFLFLASDEQTMDVTIETLDADDNVLFSETVNNVPFKRNRTTVLTGKLFTAGVSAGSFTINTDWLSNHNMDF